jgi:acyl carrier protein
VTSEEIRATVLRILGRIAPEVSGANIRMDVNLREQVDLDSMDFLNFVIGIGEEMGVEIAETDYAQLDTIDDCVRYLAKRMSG